MQNNPYFSNIAYQSTQRALNLMDRNPYSKTFGCFDRYYWHFKMKDFPSASYQMGVEFLARLWADSHKDNSFYKNQSLLAWVKASFEYTCSIQNKDGSFDEWYPNERGWAGPTSYIIHSLAQAYKLTEQEWNEDLKNKFKQCFYKAFQFLVKQKEGAHLANHTALFLLSLYEIFQITGESKIENQFQDFLQDFKKLTNEEGWSKEYDGVDFGYNLATLSFLASLYNLRPEPFLKQYAEKSFSFLSYFFYPDGSFGALGSRETIHLYPYAFKFWGGVENLTIAQDIYFHLVNNKSFENLRPFDQDDHYLFYRLSEYLLADEIALDNDNLKNLALPCLKPEPFEKHFSQAGFFIKKTNSFYLVINLKRGGAFRLYNLNKPHKTYKNKGWVLKTKNNRLITNFWYSEKTSYLQDQVIPESSKVFRGDIKNAISSKESATASNSKIFKEDFENTNRTIIKISDNQVTIEGQAFFINQRYFNPLKFILFRLFNLFVFNYKMAFLLKRFVRSLLILKKQKAKCFFRRIIYFEKEKVSIQDTIKSKESGSVFYGGEFSMRYVPQSNYFEKSDLYNRSSVFNIDKKLFVSQVYNFKTNTIKTFKKENK